MPAWQAKQWQSVGRTKERERVRKRERKRERKKEREQDESCVSLCSGTVVCHHGVTCHPTPVISLNLGGWGGGGHSPPSQGHTILQ